MVGEEAVVDAKRPFERLGRAPRREEDERSLSLPFAFDRVPVPRTTPLLPNADPDAGGPDEGDGEGKPDTGLFEGDLMLPVISIMSIFWDLLFVADLVLFWIVITGVSAELKGISGCSRSSLRFLRGEEEEKGSDRSCI